MELDISPAARLRRQAKFFSEQAQSLEGAVIADRQFIERALGIWKLWPRLFATTRHASVDAQEGQGRIPFGLLARWHQAAARYLVREAERLGMDGSPISEASRYCSELIVSERVFFNQHLESAASPLWPDMLGEKRYELPPTIQSVITDGERALSRLIARLEIAAVELPELESETEPPVKLANDARDKWLYEQCLKGVAYDTIKSRLARKEKWFRIDSINGIKSAARRYAERYDLPPIPKRQQGRPKSQ